MEVEAEAAWENKVPPFPSNQGLDGGQGVGVSGWGTAALQLWGGTAKTHHPGLPASLGGPRPNTCDIKAKDTEMH